MSKRKSEPLLNRPGGFVAVYREWFNSEAYRDLTLLARCLLAEIHNLKVPGRNGHIGFSVAKAAERLKVTPKTVRPAFHELAEHGFIVLTNGDDDYWKERLAREWRLTFERRGNSEPTDDWCRWRKGQPVVKIPSRPPKTRNPAGKN
jgi:hypothetical protein